MSTLQAIGAGVAVGVVIGAVVMAVLVVATMRSKMMVPHPSSKSFEETCAAVEAEVPKHQGWGMPIQSFDMYGSLAAKGKAPQGVRKIRLFFVCNPGHAQKVLSDSPFVSAMMPCSWSVYELDDGSVWLSKMNVGMMAKIFPGAVRDAMGQVAATEEKMLAAIL